MKKYILTSLGIIALLGGVLCFVSESYLMWAMPFFMWLVKLMVIAGFVMFIIGYAKNQNK